MTPKSKTYLGVFSHPTRLRVVQIEDGSDICRDLDMRLDLRNHSPSGFSWGFLGSGPSQLSLALLIDVLEDENRALELYQSFKAKVIARLHIEKEWQLTHAQILAAVEEIEAERRGVDAGGAL